MRRGGGFLPDFDFSFQLLDWPVGSNSLNISPRHGARWVVCPLGRPRGHGRLVTYPGGFENTEKENECSNGRFPAGCMAARPAAGRTRGYVHFFMPRPSHESATGKP